MSDPFSQPEADPDLEPIADSSGGNVQPTPGAEPPAPDDVNLLGHTLFAESASHFRVPGAMEALGWVARNRVGAPGFPSTLQGVINQKNAFAVGNTLWKKAENPSTLDPLNALAYKHAMDVARGVLSGQIADPTGGAQYFYSSHGPNDPPPDNDKFFAPAIDNGRLVRAIDSLGYPRIGYFQFFKDTASP